ncbi:TPA: type 1 fimbrial protein [Pseudomonas aeruginosa]|nr:type 1 fimbrial protein [Pseudomonas aeruginosa]HEP8853934.1 type 1 fimbrial protein [Pseudomonas aeruginosa]
MRRDKIYWLVVAFLLSLPSALYAADVTVTVNGRVVAKPCTISTSTVTVDLGELYTFSMISAGAASAWHDVTLNLNNCPVGTSKVTATFSGAADTTGYYKNQGSAKNIQLQLQDDIGVALNTGSTKTVVVDEVSQAASFNLKLRAMTVNGSVTEGSIQAIINVAYTWI